jgi:hypothetical protein
MSDPREGLFTSQEIMQAQAEVIRNLIRLLRSKETLSDKDVFAIKEFSKRVLDRRPETRRASEYVELMLGSLNRGESTPPSGAAPVSH